MTETGDSVMTSPEGARAMRCRGCGGDWATLTGPCGGNGAHVLDVPSAPPVIVASCCDRPFAVMGDYPDGGLNVVCSHCHAVIVEVRDA